MASREWESFIVGDEQEKGGFKCAQIGGRWNRKAVMWTNLKGDLLYQEGLLFGFFCLVLSWKGRGK